MQRGREGDDVLVVAADVQHQAGLLAAVFKVTRQADLHHLVHQFLARRKAIGLADFGTQRQAQPIHIADLGMALLQVFQALQKMRATAHHHRLIVGFGQHLHGLQADRRTERRGRKSGMGGAGRKQGGVDELFPCP